MTLRTRLTLSYAGLVTGCGAILITLVYLYMRYVPNYQISDASTYPMPLENGVPGVPANSPTPSGTDKMYQLAPAATVRSVDDILSNLLLASVIALVVLALIGGFIGWVVAGRIIQPLSAINKAAARASTGALDHRLHLDGPDDEIQHLADTFDGMLGSLERSFAAHQRFAANASHELRTPLSTTKTMIDVTLGDPEVTREELLTLSERISVVNQSSIDTVEALLDLADAESQTLRRDPVDLAEVVRDVAAGIRPGANEAGLSWDVVLPEGALWIHGDQVLVRQAVTNLLRNAIRHNLSANGWVRIELNQDGPDPVLTVSNSGPVVPASSVEALTEPFVRGAGRGLTRGTGHGLGLAIVDAVVRAHDGQLTLEAHDAGGLSVRMLLPGRAAG